MRLIVRTVVMILGVGTLAAPQATVFAQGGAGQVVIRATTGDGEPVLDLKPEEVSIRVDGRPRQIGRMELVRAGTPSGTPAASPTSAPPAPALPPPFETNVTNGAQGGREFLIAVDNEGIASGRDVEVRNAIAKMIGMLTPADRVGLIAMSHGGLNIPPTTQHANVLAALPKLVTTGSAAESAADLACRSKVMLGTLGGFLREGGPERSIIFVSPAMSPITQETMRRPGTGEGNRPDSAQCEIRMDDLEGLGRTAAASPSALFVVWHAEGIANGANRSNGQAGLENVAGVAGAEWIPLTGVTDAPGTRILRLASAYYVATLEDAAGAARRVDVRVNRDGVRAVARPMAAASAPAGGRVTPRDMIRVATVYRDLPLHAAAFVSRQTGGSDLVVLALFEPADANTKLTAASVVFYDQKGTARAQWNAQKDDLQALPVRAASAVPPGAYRMRVAATDAGGRAGTTDVQVRAELPEAPPVKLGSLIMGTDPRSPKLQFGASDKQVIGFLPIYGVTKHMEISVTYEIRESESAPPRGTTGGNPIPVPGGAPDERMFWGGFGLEPLVPGDYLMRAVVSVNGKEVGAATRTLRKTR